MVNKDKIIIFGGYKLKKSIIWIVVNVIFLIVTVYNYITSDKGIFLFFAAYFIIYLISQMYKLYKNKN